MHLIKVCLEVGIWILLSHFIATLPCLSAWFWPNHVSVGYISFITLTAVETLASNVRILVTLQC